MSFVSGSTTNPGGSYAPASGTDTMLLWVTGATGVGTATVSGQDFGGSSMSEVTNSDQSVNLAGSGDPTIATAYLLSPGTTSQTCSLTWSSSRLNEGGYAFTVDGVGSVTGGSGGTYSGSGTTEPSLSYDAEDGDTVVYVRQHCRGGGAISWTAPTNFTERSNIALVTSPGRRSMAVWTRDVTSTLTSQTVQASESADGDGVHHVFVIKAASNDVSVTPVTAAITVAKTYNPFVLAPNIASLINTVDNHVAKASVASFGNGGSNTSDATYRDETDEVIAIRNGSATADVYDLGVYGTLVKTITLNFDGSDCEGICDMGGGEFATCSEDGGRYQFNIYDWPSDVGTTATSKQEFTIAANAADNNSGPEGICYDRSTKTFYIVGEGEETSTDREFFKILRPGVDGRFGDTSTSYAYNDADDGDGWSLDDYISQPWDPETAFSSYGATGATFDLSSIDFDHASGNVLIASHTGQKVLQVDVTDGTVVAEIDNTDLTQMEGVAILPDGEFMMMGEADEYQIFESVLNISASVATITLATFAGTVETSSPTNVTATLDTIAIAEFNPTVEVLINTNVDVTLDTIAIAGINPSVEVLINTNVSSTLDTIAIATLSPTVEVLVNQNIAASLDAIAIAGINPSVQIGSAVSVFPSAGVIALTTFNPSVEALVNLSVSATLDTVVITGFNPTLTLTAFVPSFVGSGTLMYSLDETYYNLN